MITNEIERAMCNLTPLNEHLYYSSGVNGMRFRYDKYL